MKHPLLIACAAAFLGCGIAAYYDRGSVALAENVRLDDDGNVISRPDPRVARDMGFQTMQNGTIVYEELPGAANPADITQIAPAAGSDNPAVPGAEDGPVVQFVYDPLTQTYRRRIVDSQGNSGQDVINTNNR